jgi:hypothetical protein
VQKIEYLEKGFKVVHDFVNSTVGTELRKRSERLFRHAFVQKFPCYFALQPTFLQPVFAPPPADTKFDLDDLSRESAEARIAIKNSKTTKKKSDQGVQ